MRDPAGAFFMLPTLEIPARERAIEELLEHHAEVLVPIAEAAVLRRPPPPVGADPEAYTRSLEIHALQFLSRAGDPGLRSLLRVSEARPSACATCMLGFVAHERPEVRELVGEAIARTLGVLDPAEIVCDAGLDGLLAAAAHDPRVSAGLDAIVVSRPDLGVHLVLRWAQTSGREPIARHAETLRTVVREGLLPIARGGFRIFAVGMRLSRSDAPVFGELVAAELLLALDRSDAEVRAWLARQSAEHPDPELAARAAQILTLYVA